MARPALFLDRDGVVNMEKEYVHRIEDFEFIDGIFPACRAAMALGYGLVIITNQAGIGRGLYDESDYTRLTDWMIKQFRHESVVIDGTYFCPHHPVHGVGSYHANCNCRKPAPGMILQAAEELDLHLASSVLVGDKASDIKAGRAAGIGKCYLVETGHVLTERDRQQADIVLGGISDVIPLLKENASGQ